MRLNSSIEILYVHKAEWAVKSNNLLIESLQCNLKLSEHNINDQR